MIQRLDAYNKAEIAQYFSLKTLWSQFFFTFIKEHGYGGGFFNIYGCYDDNGEMCGLFGTIADNLMVFSHNNTIPAAEIVGFLRENGITYSIIKGQEDLLKQFEKFDKFTTKYKTLMCKLRRQDYIPAYVGDVRIERAQGRDINSLIAFFNSGEEYKRFMNEDNLREFIDFGHTYMLYDENGAISAVSICSSLNSQIAAISVITTTPAARGRGYGTKLLSYACGELLKHSDACSLCYDRPTSVKIYLKVGFHEIGYQAIYIK